ncbi:patatin-like phospholipase domain-containing protein 2 isoform X2 [Gadus morhua]|uniref:patatin-like phospholipase domain-containing protein 2 isoform X2 n=1 Tax=Gadus morhua TaxID=8049 RepID=UPI0011B42A5A|nr:patatin-like phospholipase domain-containing protein 2 isoform X2 [Gadus morhua]
MSTYQQQNQFTHVEGPNYQTVDKFFEGASKIYGASAGALMAMILTIGTPLEKSCLDLMSMTRDARKHKLGPLHPAFNLQQLVRDSMTATLPADAHLRASGRLCVSLTRVSDGKNVIVSEFDTREELIQAVLCSCFIPFYCGLIPPTYRGVRYVDGAVSDNLPNCHLRNTVTFSAFAGESDVCPRSAFRLHEVRFNNVSIHVNSQNCYRVASSFFPPEPEGMAEICDNGYLDALRFLQDNGLVPSETPLAGLAVGTPCCDLGNPSTQETGPSEGPELSSRKEGHSWLRPQLIENLPLDIKRALCEGCREKHARGSMLSQVRERVHGNMASYLRIPYALPMDSALMLVNRVADWIPELPRGPGWLYGTAGRRHSPAESGEQGDPLTDTPPPRDTSWPSELIALNQSGEEFVCPLTPEATPIPADNNTLSWDIPAELHQLSLTPPPTPPLGPADHQGAGWGSGLGRAVGWFRQMGSEKGSAPRQSDMGGGPPDMGPEDMNE